MDRRGDLGDDMMDVEGVGLTLVAEAWDGPIYGVAIISSCIGDSTYLWVLQVSDVML